MIALWGNWAIYYWAMVFGLNANYLQLKAGLPVLFIQIIATIVFLMRKGLTRADLFCRPATTPPPSIAPIQLPLFVPVIFFLCMTGIALAVWHVEWSASPVWYNLLWGLAAPIALTLYLKHPRGEGYARQKPFPLPKNTAFELIDLTSLIIALMIVIWLATKTGFPTPDDAFYAHVISSTLANPEAPVQGQDFLLGTPAPYSLYPGYRTSGFEVLAALISDIGNLDPLWVYFNLYPLLGVSLWILVAHLFLRSLAIPYPGIGIFITVLIFLNWGVGKSFGNWFISNIYMGKGFVCAILAPLLFSATAIFCQRPVKASWLLLFLSVCGAIAWSSTALLVAPITLALAAAVHLPIRRQSLAVLSFIGMTLIPLFILLYLTFRVVHQTPPFFTDDGQTGKMLVDGSVFGGSWTKALFLVTLLALPVLAAITRNKTAYSRLVRFSMAGALSVYAPYWVEVIAHFSGIHLLSWRIQWAFPSALIAGCVSGLLFSKASKIRWENKNSLLHYGAIPAGAIVLWGAMFIISLDGPIKFGHRQGVWAIYREVNEEIFTEAKSVHALIPEGAYVVPGHLEAHLPLLPNPPKFIGVRHYLNYHKNVMDDAEYKERSFIQEVTNELMTPQGLEVDNVTRSVAQSAQSLGVTTFVYRATPMLGPGPERKARLGFIDSLTIALENAGYRCEVTASGATKVCNASDVRRENQKH